jgi:DHA1 family tetracycline resistance protein-like MFS transporter
MKNSPLFIVFLTVLIDLIGFGILIPVIPELFHEGGQYFLMPGNSWFEANKFTILGVLTASYPIAQFFASPILGQISDKYGRKKVLAVCLLGTAIGHSLFAYGIHERSLILLFVARIFDGVTGGNISVAQAVIADISTPNTRQKNFGLIGAAFGLGFILGPFLGGVLASNQVVSWFDAASPFYFATALSLANVVFVLKMLPETHTHINKNLILTPSKSIRNIIHAFTLKSTLPLFITVFLFQGGFSFYSTFSSTYLLQRFGMTERDIGLFFAYIGVWIVITQGFILRRIAGKFAEHKLVRYSLFVISVTLFLYPAMNHLWYLFILVPFYAIPIGITNATITSLVSRSVGPNLQGEILGINSSFMALAQAIPPIIAGFIVSGSATSASITVSSIIVAIGAIYFWLSYKPHVAHIGHTKPKHPGLFEEALVH